MLNLNYISRSYCWWYCPQRRLWFSSGNLNKLWFTQLDVYLEHFAAEFALFVDFYLLTEDVDILGRTVLTDLFGDAGTRDKNLGVPDFTFDPGLA